MPDPIVLTCSVLGSDLRVRGATVTEALDAPTRATIEVETPTVFALEDTLGQLGVIAWEGRKLPLVITEIEQIAIDESIYAVVLEHPVVRLKYRRDHRTFLQKSVKDIVTTVVKAAGITTLTWSASRGTTPRIVCVQYGETDYDFVMRLLADEGIFWLCPDGAAANAMTFADAASAFTPVDGGAEIPIDQSGTGTGVHELTIEHIVTSGAVSLVDYDYEHPGLDLTSRVTLDASPAGEVFSYPGGFATQADGAALAQIRAEEIACRKVRVEGKGNVRTFQPGRTFKVVSDTMVAPPDTLVLREVVHELGGGGADYKQSFVAQPSAMPYRPQRTQVRPIAGTLVAQVTGPASSEISVDALGRFTSLYAFDRLGKNDDTSSQQIRLAQPMLGGGMMIARVGSELALRHLEGDPDRPVGVARMYDGLHPPPEKLPDLMTKTSFETLNSTGGDKVNAITIDDKNGAMMMEVKAAKDLDATVLHDETESIGANDTLTVGTDETILIGDKQVTTIDKNETSTAAKDVGIEIAGDRTKSVTKDETATVQGGLSVRVDGADTESVGQDLAISADVGFLETTKGKYDLTVTGAVTAKTKKDYTIWVGGKSSETVGASKTVSSSDGPLTEAVKGDASLTVGGAWTETVDGNRLSTAQGDMERTVGAAGTITAAGKLQIKGKTIKITVTGAATFVGGGGSLVVSPASVVFLGIITLKGSGGVEVSGVPQMAG